MLRWENRLRNMPVLELRAMLAALADLEMASPDM
jgi:hypothetical protein